MAHLSSWLCAIAVLLAALVQSQAQSNAANEQVNKSPDSNERKYSFGSYRFGDQLTI